MKVDLLDLKEQYTILEKEIDAAIKEVLLNTQFIMGPNVRKLEEDIGQYTGVKHAIGVANGTDALVICLRALNIGVGDEVITTPYTFFASAETTSVLGATPVFADIDPHTLCIDVEKVEEKITSRTKAIIPVHIFGQMCDMDKLMALSAKYNIPIIEDACQAIGAEYNGKKAGAIGLMGTYSFFPSKNLGCFGDGGMITTNDDSLAEKIKMLRVHGCKVRYHNEIAGYNSRLDEIQAAILNVKFKYLDSWSKQRAMHADYYTEKLKQYPLIFQEQDSRCKHVYHQYCVQVKDAVLRDKLVQFLKEQGISTAIYYPIPVHLLDVYKDHSQKEGSCPITEEICKRNFALPMYPELSREKQDYVIEKIGQFFNNIM